MHQMRAVALSNFVEVATSLGLDGQRMLRRAGLSAEVLANPENRIPASVVLGLLDRAAEESGCENFGLLMAETRSFASLGPLSLLLERLPNVGAMMRAAIDFQRHMNDVISLSLEDAGDSCVFRFDFAPGYWSVQGFDHCVTLGYRVLTAASRGNWRPDCVHLVRKPPDDPSPWRRVFAVPLEFDAAFNGFSSSAAAMQNPNPRANPAMARHARELLHLIDVDSTEDSLTERVRRSITLLLPKSRATIDQVAAQLGLSARSLQRRLDDEGEQFGDLLSGVRRELATGYLANSTQPVTTVASLVGYASPSSFTRWFAGEFGKSPQAWRARDAIADASGPPPTWRR